MKKEVRVLILEDDPADVLRLTMELRQGGIQFQSQHVYSRDGFRKALDEGAPDLILSDQGLPSFDGHTALEIAQQRCPQVPFIIVSGTYSQETAVEMLMNGAADYIYKGNLSELVPAVNQALAEAERVEKHVEQSTVPILIDEEQPALTTKVRTASTLPRGYSLYLCPKCQQLTDEQGEPQNLSDYMAEHDKANVLSTICARCSYQFQ